MKVDMVGFYHSGTGQFAVKKIWRPSGDEMRIDFVEADISELFLKMGADVCGIITNM